MTNNVSGSESYEKIAEWLEIYHTSEDDRARDIAKARIVKQMIPVVNKIARTIARRSYDPIEDMVQAGFIGLLKAIERYSKEKNDNFRVYAGYCIIGEMKHYLRDKLSAVRVPRHIQELAIRIHNFTQTLTPEEVNSITSEEVAYALDTTASSVDLALQIDRRKSMVYLEDVYSNPDMLNFEELMPDDNYQAKMDYADAKIIFDDIIKRLPPEEQVIIDMYYKQDMNKREIANALMVTPMNITRRMKQAFNIISSMIIEDSERREIAKGNLMSDES